jgi:hypothetical protein
LDCNRRRNLALELSSGGSGLPKDYASGEPLWPANSFKNNPHNYAYRASCAKLHSQEFVTKKLISLPDLVLGHTGYLTPQRKIEASSQDIRCPYDSVDPEAFVALELAIRPDRQALIPLRRHG